MPGKVDIVGSGQAITITLNGDNGDISAGGLGQHGNLILRDAHRHVRIESDGGSGTLLLRAKPVATGPDSPFFERPDPTIELNGGDASVVFRERGIPTIRIDGVTA